MNDKRLREALKTATEAAEAAGALMRRNLTSTKKVNEEIQYDLKLELDVRCQKLIEKTVLSAFPESCVFGEEGVKGDESADYQWIVDPIDGTVNFAYEIPFCCVSIALQQRRQRLAPKTQPPRDFETILGLIYNPFSQELWTAIRGKPAMLNGKKIQVSPRKQLNRAIIATGFSKFESTMAKLMPVFKELNQSARKVRMMGSAALHLAYVACGRFDAYLEYGVRHWDIAAGGFIIEQAGGEFWRREIGPEADEAVQGGYLLIANNGRFRKPILNMFPTDPLE